MNQSPEIDKLAEALAAAQSEFLPIKKDKQSHHGHYASLESCITATQAALSKHGLAISQPSMTDPNTGIFTLTTVLIHKSGQWLSSSLSLKPNRNDAQAVGSLVTYFQRYGRNSMLGVAAAEDDDGNNACEPELYTATLEQKRWFMDLCQKVSDGMLPEEMGKYSKMMINKPLEDIEKLLKELTHG